MKRFVSKLLTEGIPTSDFRRIEPGAVTSRELPLTLMAQFETPEFGGHARAKVAGKIDRVWREGDNLMGAGVLDTDGEAGAEAARLIENGFMTGISVDMAASKAEITETEDGTPMVNFLQAELLGATIVPFPAFSVSVIEIAGDAVTASGAINTSFTTLSPSDFTLSDGEQADPSDPPFDWFLDPQFSAPTKMTVTDDGRIFGHACQWDTCHSGILDECVLAPRGTDYSSYHLGVRYVNDSGQRSELAVGSLLMGTAHADHSLSPSEVANHYDDASTTVAHIRCGEDEHGVWFAGALVPGLSSTEVIQLRGASVSGDWRRGSKGYGFYGLIAVGVPGFPVKPSAVTAGGSISSLHGFGIIGENEVVLDEAEIEQRVEIELSRRAKLDDLNDLRDNLRAETLSNLAQPDSTKE